MLNWLRKKLGYHVCEEFTEWEELVLTAEEVVICGGVQRPGRPFSRVIRVRECLICAALQIATPAQEQRDE